MPGTPDRNRSHSVAFQSTTVVEMTGRHRGLFTERGLCEIDNSVSRAKDSPVDQRIGFPCFDIRSAGLMYPRVPAVPIKPLTPLGDSRWVIPCDVDVAFDIIT